MRIALLVAFMLTACATPYQHWLTDKEDADLKAKCEHTNCVMVPGALWEQIKQFVRSFSGTGI